ncbi:hypothetical protein PQX77_014477 [Marasmius sp. AFHP31]|nr:hypothetical protein PQX77_014477 [Marasmius sp. AFHP31]
MESATEMAAANNQTRNAHERYRFEDCADGPWEYVLVPSERAKGGDVPRLYHRTSTGTIPITFDSDDFDSLPRFTSSAHPLFVMLHLIFNLPEARHYSSAVTQQVFVPFMSYELAWPISMDDLSCRVLLNELTPRYPRTETQRLPVIAVTADKHQILSWTACQRVTGAPSSLSSTIPMHRHTFLQESDLGLRASSLLMTASPTATMSSF